MENSKNQDIESSQKLYQESSSLKNKIFSKNSVLLLLFLIVLGQFIYIIVKEQKEDNNQLVFNLYASSIDSEKQIQAKFFENSTHEKIQFSQQSVEVEGNRFLAEENNDISFCETLINQETGLQQVDCGGGDKFERKSSNDQQNENFEKIDLTIDLSNNFTMNSHAPMIEKENQFDDKEGQRILGQREENRQEKAPNGMMVNINTKYTYMTVCYPRCRRWRCSKHCEDFTLWRRTKRSCTQANPVCTVCTNHQCECAQLQIATSQDKNGNNTQYPKLYGHECPNLYRAIIEENKICGCAY